MTIDTPCIQVCVLDPTHGLCVGCGRTGNEIGAWASLAPPDRRAIMATLPARMVAAGLSPVHTAPVRTAPTRRRAG